MQVSLEKMMIEENENSSPSMSPVESTEPSKCHRVCILIISFITVMLSAGLSRSYGIFLIYFVDKKVITSTEGAWALGLEQFFFCSTGEVFITLINLLQSKEKIYNLINYVANM